MKNLKNAGTILCILLCITMFSACAPDTLDKEGGRTAEAENNIDNPDPEPPVDETDPDGFPILDAEIKKQIQQDLWDAYLSSGSAEFGNLTMEEAFPIPVYYGTYNGYVVIKPYGSNFTMGNFSWEEDFGYFSFPDHSPIVVWKDHAFYTMAELNKTYHKSELTWDDILTIHDVHKKIYGLPVLDAKIKRQIQQQIWDIYLSRGGTGFYDWPMEFMYPIYNYFGTYNGYAVIIPGRPLEAAVLWSARVGDVLIFQAGTPPQYIIWEGLNVGVGIAGWKDSVFYTLQELYEQGELTRKDLLAMKEVGEKLKAFGCR